MWETRFVIPEVGNAIRFFRQPAFQHGVFWAGFVGLILLGLTRIWARPAVEVAPAGALAISLEDEAAAREKAARRATAAARAAAGAMADAAGESMPRRTGGPAVAATTAARAARGAVTTANDEQATTGTEDENKNGARSA